MRILHIIVCLDGGGAELMLKRLAEAQALRPEYQIRILSLTSIGDVGRDLLRAGIEVQAIGMRSALQAPRALASLVRATRSFRPQIVQTWMYHADLIGGIAARIAGNRNVIWGVRGGALSSAGVSTTGLIRQCCVPLSYVVPRLIVCCADSARAFHAGLGYDRDRMLVIPNGYDMSCFQPSPSLRKRSREAFGFGDDELVIGIVGRFDPLKDHQNFVQAVSRLSRNKTRIKFLMIGRGVDGRNRRLAEWIAASGRSHDFTLAGERRDIPACLAAMDIFCLSSSSEGFPNVVCEAMAMALPCVVTNAGEAADIVSDIGIVAPVRDAKALSLALQRMIDTSPSQRQELGQRARDRVAAHYSLSAAVSRFDALYRQAMESRAG